MTNNVSLGSMALVYPEALARAVDDMKRIVKTGYERLSRLGDPIKVAAKITQDNDELRRVIDTEPWASDVVYELVVTSELLSNLSRVPGTIRELMFHQRFEMVDNRDLNGADEPDLYMTNVRLDKYDEFQELSQNLGGEYWSWDTKAWLTNY